MKLFYLVVLVYSLHSGFAAAPCKDLISSRTCKAYKTAGYCTTNYWVKTKCRSTCNICSTPQTTAALATTRGTCYDIFPKNTCLYYGRRGYCKKSRVIQAKCKFTCNLCGTDRTTKQPVTSTTTKPTPVNTQTYPTQAPGSCGISNVKTGRVIAGENSKADQWPWQIAMYKNNRFSCGGSLITPEWIVTAAHCVQRTSPSTVTVVLGDLDRGSSSGNEQKIQVSKIIDHSKYGRLNYDIALLKLSKPAVLNDHVRTVCLPKQDEHVQVGSKCFISGWGKTRHPGGSVNKLQHASMTIISKAECHRTNSKIVPISDQMVCAKNKAPARQSGCHGDSGGPFVCQQKSGSWTLHGAVSWGSRYCDTNDAVSVFARVAALRQWIDTTISKN